MNNEEKILAILEQMQSDMSNMQTDMSNMKTDISDMKIDISNIKLDMKEGFDRLDFAIKEVVKDIGIVEARIHQHEREYHGIA